ARPGPCPQVHPELRRLAPHDRGVLPAHRGRRAPDQLHPDRRGAGLLYAADVVDDVHDRLRTGHARPAGQARDPPAVPRRQPAGPRSLCNRPGDAASPAAAAEAGGSAGRQDMTATAGDPARDLIVRPLSYDDPVVRALEAELQAEYVARYGGED